ncbi:MAG TPA: protein kinase [Kofleriaceae bacterium]|nr:protein kinase [Kofleriaceae bacterium]
MPDPKEKGGPPSDPVLDETLDGGSALATTVASGAARRAVAGTASLPPLTDREARRKVIESPDRDHQELGEVDPEHYVHGYEVARGGMGRIVAARDRRLGRVVAIKELVHFTPERAARFEREALITARLQHPAIVNLHEAGRWPSGEPFFAMKLVSGRPLSDIVASRPPLRERLALLSHLIAATEAVAYAHQHQIIHRDLKPSNVLIGELGETVVIDWGLAKDLAAEPEAALPAAAGAPAAAPAEPADATAATMAPEPARPRTGSGSGPGLTMVGSVMGTPGFMPPEQAAGEEVDQRADVYALGAILYAALGGAEPYATSTQQKILDDVLAGPPRPLAEVEPDLPHDLVTIVDKAMARRREDRYPSAVELADDLRRFQTGQLVVAHRYSRRELVIRFVVRHRTFFTALLVALVAGALILAFTFRRIVRERDRAEAASERAARRADELALARAASLLEDDPRQALSALAAVSPDAPPPVWRRARMVASEARLRGVPTVLRGHGAAVEALDLSQKGDLLVSGDHHAVHVWNLATGEGRLLASQPSPIHSVRISPDGTRVATAALDGAIRIWNTADGWGTQLSGHEALVHPVEFLPDGRLLSYSMDGTIRAWHIDAGSHDLIGKQEGAILLGVTADDHASLVTVGEDRVVRIWPTGVGRAPPAKSRELRGPESTVRVLAVSADGARVAAGGRFGTGWLWEVATGAARKLEGHDEAGIRELAFSPDGRRLASAGSDHTVRLWDVASGKSEVLRGHEDVVFHIAFDRAGTQLLSAAADGTVRIWSLGDKTSSATQVLGGNGPAFVARMSADGRTVVTSIGSLIRRWQVGGLGGALRGHRGAVTEVEIAPSGRYLVSAGEDWTVRVWPLGKGAAAAPLVLTGHRSDIQALGISPDSRFFATVDGFHVLRLWSPDGRTARALHGYGFGRPEFAPSGTLVATPSVGHTVRLWDTATGEARVLRGHTSWVISVAFAPDGRHIAAGATDGTIRVWSFPSGESKLLTGHSAPVRTLGFAGPGRLVSADLSGHVRDTDIATGSGQVLAAGSADGKGTVAVSPRGDQVAWVDREGDVQMWSRRTRQARPIDSSDQPIEVLAFAPDGRTLLGHGYGDRLLVWDTATATPMTLRTYGRTVYDAAVSPDGLSIATAESDGAVRLWPFDLPYAPARLRAWLREAGAE